MTGLRRPGSSGRQIQRSRLRSWEARRRARRSSLGNGWEIRELWATRVNDALKLAGKEERIDHRSHAARGIEQLPTSTKAPTRGNCTGPND
ncbi:MobA/MobL family protein [Edaphobacter paludis]|uniref:MobA/MobL family protein n=1 Tax=Edaphobacter paludis TaxID=3035702 RepID=A0AAU7DDD8_9BACT